MSAADQNASSGGQKPTFESDVKTSSAAQGSASTITSVFADGHVRQSSQGGHRRGPRLLRQVRPDTF